MKQRVARTYRFYGRHALTSVGPPWNEPHAHLYTVEVVAEADVGAGGLVVDTELIDEAWEYLGLPDKSIGEHDLNASFDDTSVEGLSRMWFEQMSRRVPQVAGVTVKEDDTRW